MLEPIYLAKAPEATVIRLSDQVQHSVPFGHPLTESALLREGQAFARAMGLPDKVQIVRGAGRRGEELEASFRHAWWDNQSESLRASYFAIGRRVYEEADRSRRWPHMSSAMAAGTEITKGPAWRQAARALAGARAEADHPWLRCLFRSAQQAWTRAARWEAAFPDADSPFAPLLSLFATGAFPVGYGDEGLCLFVLGPGEVTPPRPLFPEPPVSARENYVVLSASFRGSVSPEEWREALVIEGWPVVYGPVEERIEPIEAHLGRRIRRAAAVVGLVEDVDADFGLPLWIFQELDYAVARKTPTAVLTTSPLPAAVLPAIDVLRHSTMAAGDFNRLHPLWPWLEKNTPQP